MSAALQLTGLVLEIAGVLLMANGYTRASYGRGTIRVLISALWRGRVAAEAIRQRSLTSEDLDSVLQGLAFIGLGFLLQVASTLLSL